MRRLEGTLRGGGRCGWICELTVHGIFLQVTFARNRNGCSGIQLRIIPRVTGASSQIICFAWEYPYTPLQYAYHGSISHVLSTLSAGTIPVVCPLAPLLPFSASITWLPASAPPTEVFVTGEAYWIDEERSLYVGGRHGSTARREGRAGPSARELSQPYRSTARQEAKDGWCESPPALLHTLFSKF